MYDWKSGWFQISSLKQGFSKSGLWPRNISHHLEICYKCKFLGPNPDLPNQKLSGWEPSLCVQTNAPGDSDEWSKTLCDKEKEECLEFNSMGDFDWKKEMSLGEWRGARGGEGNTGDWCQARQNNVATRRGYPIVPNVAKQSSKRSTEHDRWICQDRWKPLDIFKMTDFEDWHKIKKK